MACRSSQAGEWLSLIFQHPVARHLLEVIAVAVDIRVVHSLRRLDGTKFVIVFLSLHHSWHLADSFGAFLLLCWLFMKRASKVV